MTKLKGLLILLRFELPLSAGICVVLGQVLAAGSFAPPLLTITAFFSVFCISGAILAMNDYFDIETDKINAPHRPIPAGMVSPAEALWFSVIVWGSGLLLALSINIYTFAAAVILSVVGFLYNRRYKKSGLPGNLMVCFSVGMTFIYGGFSVNIPLHPMVWLFAVIAALVDLGEEIAADAMDAKGDELINSRSIAIRYGRAAAIKTSTAIFSLVILLTFIPFFLEWFPVIYIIPITLMDIFIGYSAFKLYRSKNQEGRKYIRTLYLGATLGLLLFLVMRWAGV